MKIPAKTENKIIFIFIQFFINYNLELNHFNNSNISLYYSHQLFKLVIFQSPKNERGQQNIRQNNQEIVQTTPF